MARRVHSQRASEHQLRNGSDAGRRCSPGGLRLGLHQRHDHRHPARGEARRPVVGAGEIPDHEQSLPRPVLEPDPECAHDDGVVEVAGDHPGRALLHVPEDLRQSEVEHVADPGFGAGVHEPRTALLPAVAGRQRQGSELRPQEPREAARRAGRPGRGRRRRGAVSHAATTAGARAPAVATRRRARRRADWRRRRLVLLLMSPWIVGFTVFFAYPLVMSAYLSFNHYDLLSPPRWVGWANYHYLLHVDPQTWVAVKNTVYWMVLIAVPVQVLFAFCVATLLVHAKSGSGFFRTVFYLPAL